MKSDHLFFWAYIFILSSNPLTAQQLKALASFPQDSSDSRAFAFIDYDQDGWLDIMISNGSKQGQSNRLYQNDQQGGFSLAPLSPIQQDNAPSDGVSWADIDNDGKIDAFVANWYGKTNLLYLNKGQGRFQAIFQEQLQKDLGYSETASWGDYDRDGKVDLYVSNSAGKKLNILYHNQGAGKFQAMPTATWLANAKSSRSVNWLDVDQNGTLDLFVSNENKEPNQLFLQNPQGLFHEVAFTPITTDSASSMSSNWIDYDNDGDWDLFVSNYGRENRLYENLGGDTFQALSGNPLVEIPGCSFGSAWADYDNDGDLDLFVAQAFCRGDRPQLMYCNEGKGRFTIDTLTSAQIHTGWGYGCAWGDYNRDGWLDLGVAYCKDAKQPNQLYQNQGGSNHWIQLKLVGTVSNHSAIGAVVKLKSKRKEQVLSQMRQVSAQHGYCSQNSLWVHAGLAEATHVDSVEILWPSGLQEQIGPLEADRIYTCIEGKACVIMP